MLFKVQHLSYDATSVERHYINQIDIDIHVYRKFKITDKCIFFSLYYIDNISVEIGWNH